ncbi:hypothetical protein KC19_VG210000 [Ceratodon purpureus]|uniref:Uncharacterized protein n=1 Tax=Ceratodon purpureus TaxID=3225 RepID=A0A8T0HST0_CERPU|nr:hypothetical protein KC19_VG210000 [Ceratodon purpureus]
MALAASSPGRTKITEVRWHPTVLHSNSLEQMRTKLGTNRWRSPPKSGMGAQCHQDQILFWCILPSPRSFMDKSLMWYLMFLVLVHIPFIFPHKRSNYLFCQINRLDQDSPLVVDKL